MKFRTTTIRTDHVRGSKLKKSPKPDKCVICFSSNRTTAVQLCTEYGREIQKWGPYPIVVVGVHAEDMMWYTDENSFIETINALDKQVEKILAQHKISKEKTFLVGFTEGATIAASLADKSDEPYAGVIAHSISKPVVPLSECDCPNTEFVLMHNQDDKISKWDETYLLFKESLNENGYKWRGETRATGGHFYNVSLAIPVIMNKLLTI